MLLELQHFSKPQKTDFIERAEVEIAEVLRKRWTRSPVRDTSMFQPKLNVLDDESLLLDHSLKGAISGTGY